VALRLTFSVSIAATALVVVLGLPLALTLARGTGPWLRVLRVLVLTPLVLPPVVAGVGLLAALGTRGVAGAALTRLGVRLVFSTAGAAVAAAFVAMPLFTLAAEAGFRSLDPRLDDAARAMGASRFYAFRRITLPLVAPHLAAGIALAWARAAGEFGATITFAGNRAGATQTLPLAIYESFQTDPGAAILMAVMLAGLSLLALVALEARLAPQSP
jgi:molybdate transport system permease protein